MVSAADKGGHFLKTSNYRAFLLALKNWIFDEFGWST